MRLHPKQRAFYRSQTRYDVAPCGRRSGKTEIVKRKMVRRAMMRQRFLDPWYLLTAPTHDQAIRLYWRDVKNLIPRWAVDHISESRHTVRLLNGSEISVMGLDKPERAEGRPIDGIGLDEFGNMKASVWEEHIRPGLVDHQGWAIIFGVPEGRNHYHTLYETASADDSGYWSVHHWTTEEILHLYLGEHAANAEIEAAKRDMDTMTYDQEFRASFVVFEGQIYYNFNREVHACSKIPYLKHAPLIICLDFNRAPGVALIVQEIGEQSCILDEVYIPRNSNTVAVCRAIIERYGKHKGHIYVYGDATGGAQHSSSTEGSDWNIVERMLHRHFGIDRVHFRVPHSNPSERARVNSVNSHFKSVDGYIGVRVDKRCIHTIRDFEGVRALEGGSGEIDKKRDKKLTHLSDAWGYYCAQEYPVSGGRKLTIEEVA